MLKDERWTRRKVALAIGATPTYVNARMNGQVDLSFADIEVIAPLLRMTGAELFVALQEGTKNAPTPKGEGEESKLPELDSNQQPAGFKPISYLPVLTNTNVGAEHSAESFPVTKLHA